MECRGGSNSKKTRVATCYKGLEVGESHGRRHSAETRHIEEAMHLLIDIEQNMTVLNSNI